MGIQHRCFSLSEVWRRSQVDRQHQEAAEHRQDSGSPQAERRIAAAHRMMASGAGLARFKPSRIASGLHTALHGTATEQQAASRLSEAGSSGRQCKRVDSVGSLEG